MTIDDHIKNIYTIQKHLKLEEIANAASRLVKDVDTNPERGMVEVGYRFIQKLDKLLFELDNIQNKITKP